MSTSPRKGSISVNTADILPIIKKWLYSEHDIFLRELISNACDAITKRKTLATSRNEAYPEPKIEVLLSKKAKTITIRDNGIGMSEPEVEKYLAQLAFSGAQEFIEKMKGQGADRQEDIIGKFGLGFYSAFMVSDSVAVNTLSMEAGAVPVQWRSQGEIEYEFSASERDIVGTEVVLTISEGSAEFLEDYRLREVLRRYCSFMPYPIELKNLDDEKSSAEVINELIPLWKKAPSSLKDEDYLAFYRQRFPMEPDPLFWIHLNIDHPFHLMGVLYFPKLNTNKPVNEHDIHLYVNQVFVSDNVKNIVPEFLTLLKGYIDSSDIPLNVSRSSLQGDPNIKKIANYVIKKVAESLKKLFNNERERYNQIWEDIGLFVRYGAISDDKFDEVVRDMILFRNSQQALVTLDEYRQSIPEKMGEKLKGKVLYFEKGRADSCLLDQIHGEGVTAVEIDQLIDPHLQQTIEMKKRGEHEYKFVSLASEIENLYESKLTTDEHIKVKELFKKFLAPVSSENTGADSTEKMAEGPEIEVRATAAENGGPAYIKIDETMKRFKQMTRAMGSGNEDAFPLKKTLVINPENPLVQNALKLSEQSGQSELAQLLCEHIHDLAIFSAEGLTDPKGREQFIKRSQRLIQQLSSQVVS